jgi:hypothetical protein
MISARNRAGAAHGIGRQVVGDAAGAEAAPDLAQRRDHGGADVAGEQRQHVAAAHLGAERAGLLGKQSVERVDVDLGALEFRPSILQVIGRVGAADDVGRQAALALETGKGLEGRGGDHPAEVENHGFDHHASIIMLDLVPRSNGRRAGAATVLSSQMRAHFTSGQPPSFSGRNAWSPGTSASTL